MEPTLEYNCTTCYLWFANKGCGMNGKIKKPLLTICQYFFPNTIK